MGSSKKAAQKSQIWIMSNFWARFFHVFMGKKKKLKFFLQFFIGCLRIWIPRVSKSNKELWRHLSFLICGFLVYLKTQKFPFEINWPLDMWKRNFIMTYEVKSNWQVQHALMLVIPLRIWFTELAVGFQIWGGLIVIDRLFFLYTPTGLDFSLGLYRTKF